MRNCSAGKRQVLHGVRQIEPDNMLVMRSRKCRGLALLREMRDTDRAFPRHQVQCPSTPNGVKSQFFSAT